MVAPASAAASTSCLVKMRSIRVSFAQKKTPAPGGGGGLEFRVLYRPFVLAGHSPREGGNKKDEYEQERGGRQGHRLVVEADRVGQLHVKGSKSQSPLRIWISAALASAKYSHASKSFQSVSKTA